MTFKVQRTRLSGGEHMLGEEETSPRLAQRLGAYHRVSISELGPNPP